MKSKAKKKKIAQMNQQKRSGGASVASEWLYLAKDEIILRQLYELFEDSEQVQANLWEEAGVLELEIPEHKSIDIELAEDNFEDVAFFSENDVKTVLLVTIVPAEFSYASNVMKEIVEKIGGAFCEDNEDFSSMIGAL